jgi:type I restriction enzyme S subunit
MLEPSLPNEWRVLSLGETCDHRIEVRDPRANPENRFWYIDITSVDNEAKSIVAPKELVGKEAPSRARQVVRAGDVIVSTTRPNLNAVAVVPADLDRQICSTGFCVLRPKDGLDSRYLFNFVQSSDFVRRLVDLVRGALYPAVTDKQVRSQLIPLPELSEQRRITSRLSLLLEEIERARAAGAQQLIAARALHLALLGGVFNSQEAQHWPRVRLQDLLLSPLRTGISKPALAKSDKVCLTLSAVRNGELDLAASKPVDVNDSEAQGNWVKAGAFYVVRGNGNRSLVGRGAIAPSPISSPVLYPDLLIEVNFDPARIDARYLRLAWDSADVRRDIEDRARTSAGIYKINQANLREVSLRVPPLADQMAVASLLSKQLTIVEGTKVRLDEEINNLSRLRVTLLTRAFSGGL